MRSGGTTNSPIIAPIGFAGASTNAIAERPRPTPIAKTARQAKANHAECFSMEGTRYANINPRTNQMPASARNIKSTVDQIESVGSTARGVGVKTDNPWTPRQRYSPPPKSAFAAERQTAT